ncbi:hypothetical protein BLNAU_24408 [Blattamonas nauphoetae]|uniref:Uncharacterized protein n=1 Tax=Blattamonas nauphoetae TaxID=2049346 RepID=A0ABQ9WPK2_9EUKA|nr:hypothetical protein BLNAU_24408 [Blattamonas nauphoetae]
MQPFVVPPACSPRPPLIRLNKAVLPPHRHFSDAPITLLRNYINAKIPVADAHFIPFCIFPSISPKNQFLDPDLLCSYNSTGMDASSQLQLRHAKVAKAGFLFTKSRALSPSPPILPMKLFTLSAYNFIANHTVRRYSTKQTGQPPVYHTILTQEDLVRYIRMLKMLSVHPPTHSGHPLFFPNQTDLLQNSISSSLFVVPSKRNGGDTSTRKSKRKRRYSCQPADFAADSALREADERAVALDAAVAVLSEPEQILVNTEELVKTGNSRHAIGLTRHRPRLATAARLHLHPLAARLLRRTPAASDIETIATFVRADRQKKGLSPHPICTQHLRQFISSPSIRHFLSLRVLAGIKEAETRNCLFNIVNSTLSLDALIFDVESLGCTNAKLAIPLSDTVLAVAMCDCGDILCLASPIVVHHTHHVRNQLHKTSCFLMDLRGNLNPNPRLVIDSSNISCDKATTLPDSEHQIITHHSVSTDDSNSEFTSLDGASRTRTLQEADSIAFIQQQRPHRNENRLDCPPLIVERPKQRAQNPSQRHQNLISEQHRVMIETKRGTSGKAADAASGGCDDGEERAEQRQDLQFGQLVQFALSNFIPTNHIFCAVACGDNLRSGQVQQRENRKVAYLLSSDATSASTHPSTATTDAPTTAKAEPCPESLVRRLSGNARPSAPTNPSPLRPVSTHGDRRKCRSLRPDLARLVLRCECGHQICERVWDERRQRQMKQLHQSVQLHQRQMNKPAESPPSERTTFVWNSLSQSNRQAVRLRAGASEVSEEGRQNELRADRVGVQQFRQLRLFVSVQRQHKVKQLQRTHRTQAFLHNPLLHQLRKRLRNMKRRVLLDRRSETAQCRLQFRPEQQKVHLQQPVACRWLNECRAGNTSDGMFGEKKASNEWKNDSIDRKRTETAEPARQTATPRSAVEKGTTDQTTTAEAIQSSQIPVFCAIHRRTAESGQNSVNAVSRDAQRRQLFDNCSGNMRASENNGEGT